MRLGRTFKPSTTFGAEAFSAILNFVHKELRGTKVQNDTFTRLLAFNSFPIFHINEGGLPDAPHTGVQKLIQAMSSFGISETTANPSAVRKGGTTHDMFSEDEVAFRVYIELGNLLVLKKLEPGRKQIKLSKKSSRTWMTYTRPSKKSVRRICRTIPATTPMYNLDSTLSVLQHV